MIEIWKDISGYEGIYKISNLGRVKRMIFINNRITKKQEKISKPTDNGKGYKIVGLSKNGKRKNHYVHRLVAQAFLPNPKNFNEINHLDCDPENNIVSNLEWCSRSRNVAYSYEKGRHKAQKNMLNRRGKLHPNSKATRQYDLNGTFIKEYESGILASEATGTNYGSIKKCRQGLQKTANGFIWKYA